MKEVHKKLNLSKIDDDSDLMNISEDEKLCEEVNFIIERYNWNVGYPNYVNFKYKKTLIISVVFHTYLILIFKGIFKT